MQKLRILLLIVFVYLTAHFFYTVFVDLAWMPEPPPANPDPTSLKKRNPDGPLILREDFFTESPQKDNKSLLKNLIFVYGKDNKDGIKAVDKSKWGKLRADESFLKVIFA